MNTADELLAEFQETTMNAPVVRHDPHSDTVQKTVNALKIPDNSLLGALVRTGGFSIAGGKLKLLGSHGDSSISLISINEDIGYNFETELLVFAYDIYGNIYAINTGYANQFRPGEIIAFFSDGTDWESTADGLEDFLSYCFQGDLQGTFNDFETKEASLEMEAQASDCRVVDYFPPLYSKEGSPETSSKRLVGLVESVKLRRELASTISL